MDQPVHAQNTGVSQGRLRKPRILVAPLDWGLGHATRCIPIIKELVEKGCEVWLAGEGAQEQLLKQEFPGLNFITLKGYRVRYAASVTGFVFKIITQIPRILKSIGDEHRWLKKQVEELKIDAVISDNRYGLYHKKIPCIFITHQLAIKSRLSGWIEKIVQKKNYGFIKRFTESWIPDAESGITLAGELSHPLNKPKITLKYIGPLSRFSSMKANEEKGHLLILLSGPEPQRSMLEEKVIKEIAHYNGTATVVRGLPGNAFMVPSSNMIRFYNHLSATELNEEIEKAEWVIARSGYSTIMDIAKLNKKSILVPTPGQPEQEYLGAYLNKLNFCYTVLQKDFSLQKALEGAALFNYKPIYINSSLGTVVDRFIRDVNNK
jgi:uncharacterized protein (TIGR00661 family)